MKQSSLNSTVEKCKACHAVTPVPAAGPWVPIAEAEEPPKGHYYLTLTWEGEIAIYQWCHTNPHKSLWQSRCLILADHCRVARIATVNYPPDAVDVSKVKP